MIVQNERGLSDFEALKSAIRWQPHRLILCSFDLLRLNGKDRGAKDEAEKAYSE